MLLKLITIVRFGWMLGLILLTAVVLIVSGLGEVEDAINRFEQDCVVTVRELRRLQD